MSCGDLPGKSNPRQAVALICGGHVYGRCHPEQTASGYAADSDLLLHPIPAQGWRGDLGQLFLRSDSGYRSTKNCITQAGAWVEMPTLFSNEYAADMVRLPA